MHKRKELFQICLYSLHKIISNDTLSFYGILCFKVYSESVVTN